MEIFTYCERIEKMPASQFNLAHGAERKLMKKLNPNTAIHRVTVASFRAISMPAGFRRHLVGITLRNVY